MVEALAAVLITAAGATVTAIAWRQSRSEAARLGRQAANGDEAFVAAAPGQTIQSTMTIVLVLLSLGATVIHLAAAPHHLLELGPLGLGFIGAGLFQGGLAAAIAVRPGSRTVLLLAIVASLVIAAAWAWSRIIGLPAGATPWTPEPIGPPDAAATLFEIALAGLATARLAGLDRGLDSRLRQARAAATVALVPLASSIVLVTILASNLAIGSH